MRLSRWWASDRTSPGVDLQSSTFDDTGYTLIYQDDLSQNRPLADVPADVILSGIIYAEESAEPLSGRVNT